MSTLYKNDIVNIELETGSVSRSFACNLLAGGDENGNRFGFRCFRNGRQISLNNESNVCMGFFTRADGYTVAIRGNHNWDVAYVELPAECYDVEGNFTLVVKITSTDFAGAMRIIDGTVIKHGPETIIDQGDIIPDLSDLEDVAERAEAAAAVIRGISVTADAIIGTRNRIIVTTV